MRYKYFTLRSTPNKGFVEDNLLECCYANGPGTFLGKLFRNPCWREVAAMCSHGQGKKCLVSVFFKIALDESHVQSRRLSLH